jgi:quercetin dioxygenase-like cupin family protein
MSDKSDSAARHASAIPPDDPLRKLALVRPGTDKNIRHVGLAGDAYTILLTGQDTAGRYGLIDMHVPPGGGPPPHRHDFEEAFTLLDGELDFVFVERTGGTRRGDAPYSGKRSAAVPQFVESAGENAVHLRARRSGRILSGDWCACGNQYNAFTEVG